MADSNLRASDPRNYQLPGKVSLWFRAKGKANPQDWVDLGDIVNPSIDPVIAKLQHFSQRRGERALDREVISERSINLKFSLDEFNLDNLQLAFGSAKPVTDQLVLVNDNKVAQSPGAGLTVDLGAPDLVPGSVVVRSTILQDDETVTYSSPGDYTIDLPSGILTITPAGLLTVVDPETGQLPEFHVFFQQEVEAQAFEILDGTTIEGEAKFQILTPGGLAYVTHFKNVSVINNGAITVGEGNKWQDIPLTVEVLQDSDGKLGTMYVIKEDELGS